MRDYDIFISYKHKDESGEITTDYEIAKGLYEVLEKRGFTVFFSDETLFRMGRSDYKKAIDKALDSAELLVVIGTKQAYLLSGWVEYEYETFCEDILSGRKTNANIISYTKGITQSELPRTLARMQNFTVTDTPAERVADYIANALSGLAKKRTPPQIQPQAKSSEEKKTAIHSSMRRSSVYASDYRNELERLRIQSQNSAQIDRQAFSYVCESMPDKTERLCVLDVGSAYGFVAADRFANDPRVDKVLCIDKNERVIERAQILFADNEKMIFEVLDVESADFTDKLCGILRKHEIEKLHIVFSALTLHHLNDPKRTLRKLRSVMEDGSYIILRGSDDGSKLCYPGSELMEEIIKMTAGAVRVSDRFNGRKIFSQLSNSGFKDIRMFSMMKDISDFSYDDRGLLFQESFAYRINYFHRAVESAPDDKKAKSELEQMQEYLEEFENLFYESNFWYCEYDYVGVARK